MPAPIELTDQQRDQIIRWFVSHLPDGTDAAKAAADAGAELDRVDQALRDAGIEYPLGAAGVRDLANQRDAADENAENLRDLLRDELAHLWDDLARHIREAHNGVWSTGCESTLGRIEVFTKLLGPLHWSHVAFELLGEGERYEHLHAKMGHRLPDHYVTESREARHKHDVKKAYEERYQSHEQF